MSDIDKEFRGAIPDIYDQYLVPLIFEVYADDLAERVINGPSDSVLETAAGSGVVTRALAPHLASDARYVVSDLNPPMLARAQRQQDADDRIIWQAADALDLPFSDASFDVVLCQFGAMFFPDKVKGFTEARRVLKPGGRLLFNVWDRIEVNEFADEVVKAAGDVFQEDAPRFLARTPHGYNDTVQISGDLASAGFEQVKIVTRSDVSRADTPDIPAIAYCQGTPMRNEIEARDASRLEDVTAFATSRLAARFGSGPVSGRIQAHVIEASV